MRKIFIVLGAVSFIVAYMCVFHFNQTVALLGCHIPEQPTIDGALNPPCETQMAFVYLFGVLSLVGIVLGLVYGIDFETFGRKEGQESRNITINNPWLAAIVLIILIAAGWYFFGMYSGLLMLVVGGSAFYKGFFAKKPEDQTLRTEPELKK